MLSACQELMLPLKSSLLIGVAAFTRNQIDFDAAAGDLGSGRVGLDRNFLRHGEVVVATVLRAADPADVHAFHLARVLAGVLAAGPHVC